MQLLTMFLGATFHWDTVYNICSVQWILRSIRQPRKTLLYCWRAVSVRQQLSFLYFTRWQSWWPRSAWHIYCLSKASTTVSTLYQMCVQGHANEFSTGCLTGWVSKAVC